jgi:hypothetical protein
LDENAFISGMWMMAFGCIFVDFSDWVFFWMNSNSLLVTSPFFAEFAYYMVPFLAYCIYAMVISVLLYKDIINVHGAIRILEGMSLVAVIGIIWINSVMYPLASAFQVSIADILIVVLGALTLEMINNNRFEIKVRNFALKHEYVIALVVLLLVFVLVWWII